MPIKVLGAPDEVRFYRRDIDGVSKALRFLLGQSNIVCPGARSAGAQSS
jgi:hypothetical protein